MREKRGYEDVKQKAKTYIEKPPADRVARRFVDRFEALTSMRH